jgi:hypothetical protein
MPRGERASMCRDAPRPDTICTSRSARLVKGAALTCAAGAEPRAGPSVLHGRNEHGEHPPFGRPEHRDNRSEFRSGRDTQLPSRIRIFLLPAVFHIICQYLHSEALRREVNEGLNVVEQWNSANDFIFFARRGEMASNRREDHEISMLALHLLQNCMVYINTLMQQQVLAQPQWSGRLTARDLRALTPLIWEHVNPYGRFELDMDARLPIN